MEYDEIKKLLLEDREFREELFKLYYEDDKRFINQVMKIDGEKVGKLVTPSTQKNHKMWVLILRRNIKIM